MDILSLHLQLCCSEASSNVMLLLRCLSVGREAESVLSGILSEWMFLYCN